MPGGSGQIVASRGGNRPQTNQPLSWGAIETEQAVGGMLVERMPVEWVTVMSGDRK